MTYSQTTIGRAVLVQGIGLHGGVNVEMQIRPAGAGSGLVFLHGGARIPARAANAGKAPRCTSLEAGGATVHTVEHVLSALYGLCIDNAEIELSAPEPPAMDGSSLPLCVKLLEAGIIDLGETAEYFEVARPVFAEGNCAAAIAFPHPGLRLTSFISYGGHAMIPEQAFDTEASPGEYLGQVAPARTYGFIEEAEALRAAGLALGASEANAVAIYPDRFSPELRFDNEPARHKALDMLGDLALLGRRARGHFTCYRSGHALNAALAAKLLAGA